LTVPEFTFERRGVVFSPDGSEREAEGVLNPGIARDRDGTLLMYPRLVGPGNVSRIGIARGIETAQAVTFERAGIVLEPEVEYEVRVEPGGFGCEDPRVTYIAGLDLYVMGYTAFGPKGPRIALAISHDGYAWRRLGPVVFDNAALNALPNKDAAFFPEIVVSPKGVESFALYHRPMLLESVTGQAPIELMQSLPPQNREVTCIGYVPARDAVADPQSLCRIAESTRVLEVGDRWGTLKNGAGTPPVKTADGWLSLFHGVDARERADGTATVHYRAGLLLHDLQRPDRIVYRSPEPVLGPETVAEKFGIVDDVVFPTGIDPQPDGAYDVYYGAADARIAVARMTPASATADLAAAHGAGER
jgi:predicted GH43/DUF377 family glycosyl hydrolase